MCGAVSHALTTPLPLIAAPRARLPRPRRARGGAGSPPPRTHIRRGGRRGEREGGRGEVRGGEGVGGERGRGGGRPPLRVRGGDGRGRGLRRAPRGWYRNHVLGISPHIVMDPVGTSEKDRWCVRRRSGPVRPAGDPRRDTPRLGPPSPPPPPLPPSCRSSAARCVDVAIPSPSFSSSDGSEGGPEAPPLRPGGLPRPQGIHSARRSRAVFLFGVLSLFHFRFFGGGGPALFPL